MDVFFVEEIVDPSEAFTFVKTLIKKQMTDKIMSDALGIMPHSHFTFPDVSSINRENRKTGKPTL
jgi:hypothetical protein